MKHDLLDRDATRNLARNVIIAIAALVVLPPVACVGVHRLTHSAPLGRDAIAIHRTIDRDLPVGSSLDSAMRYMRSRGVQFRVDSTERDLSRQRADSLFANGPILRAFQPSADRDFYVWNANVRLYFDSTRTLRAREARLSAQNPL